MLRKIIAKHTGCNIETVRYYELIGLMPKPPRTDKGYRIYGTDDERRLRFILRARHVDVSIEDIRTILRLVTSKKFTCTDVRERILGQLSVVRAKIAALRRFEHGLSKTVEACTANKGQQCSAIDSLLDVQ